MTTARRLKRQESNALKIFNELWNEFVEFETSNSHAIGGYVHYQKGVAHKIKSVHKRWKYFTRCKNTNPKSMNFKPTALKDKIEEYMLLKDKQVWLSYTAELAFRKYGYTADNETFEKVYSTELLPLDAVKLLIKKENPMLTLNLSYHQLIGKYNKEVKFPENFAELTPKQFLSFMELSGKGYTEYELKIQFLRKNFFKLPITRIHALRKFAKKEKSEALAAAYYEGWLDNSSAIHDLVKLLKFLNDTPEYLNNPIPKYRLLRGPSHHLKNISIWEFALAENAMFDFLETGDMDSLDRFVAILMRPLSASKVLKSIYAYVDDYRSKFHDELIDRNIKRVRKMPEHYKFALLAYFRSTRETFKEVFPNVYGSVSKKKTPEGEDGNWGDVILQMSGEVPGQEDQVSRVNLYLILSRIDKMIDNQNKAKK